MKNFLSILLLAGAVTAPVFAEVTEVNREYSDPSMRTGCSIKNSMSSTNDMLENESPNEKMAQDQMSDAMQMMMDDMMALTKKVSGKTLSLPGSLQKDAVAVKAKMLNMVAEALRECGKLNFSGKAEEKKYEQAAQKAEAFAAALKALPVKSVMKKSFKNAEAWMKIKLEMHEIKARYLKAIGKDLKDKDIEMKADKFASMIEKYKNMASEEESQTMPEEEESSSCASSM